MTDSVLLTTKAALGLPADYTVYDAELIMHINSVLSTVAQLGVGSDLGHFITTETDTWEPITGGDPRFNLIKTYMYVSVRLLFDPPKESFVLDSMKKTKDEMEWRLLVIADNIANPYIEGEIISDPNGPVVLDGGTP